MCVWVNVLFKLCLCFRCLSDGLNSCWRVLRWSSSSSFSSFISSRTASDHDDTTTMFSSSYSVLTVEYSTSTPANNQSLSHLTREISSTNLSLSMWSAPNLRRAWRCWFCRSRSLFLGRCLSVSGDVKLDWLFQQEPVHGSPVPWWFLVCSKPSSSTILPDLDKWLHLPVTWIHTVSFWIPYDRWRKESNHQPHDWWMRFLPPDHVADTFK